MYKRQGYYYINEEEQDGRGYKTAQAIQARGSETLCAQFLYIIDEIKKIFYNKEHTITQHILNQKAVSYTHLDVYKRQSESPGRSDGTVGRQDHGAYGYR